MAGDRMLETDIVRERELFVSGEPVEIGKRAATPWR